MKKLLVLFVALATILVGCTGGVKDEKQSFIDATVEATCLVFQAENIFDPALEEQAKEIYKKYGFDADDEEAMNALTAKYENDEDVQTAIADALEECAGDFMDAFEDVDMDMELEMDTEDEMMEEEMPEEEMTEEEATEEPAEEEATEEEPAEEEVPAEEPAA